MDAKIKTFYGLGEILVAIEDYRCEDRKIVDRKTLVPLV
jgi:hypothetical protein